MQVEGQRVPNDDETEVTLATDSCCKLTLVAENPVEHKLLAMLARATSESLCALHHGNKVRLYNFLKTQMPEGSEF